ncbi:uncharacterized protein LOC133033269 [Cannabis sativa]|uniref:uncharacterized protein LOC133033269 n=1 Tax=Cannabis sativa TaxID=3483 RepID=UPI0029C9D0BF|nr:uncharacterized protein LOC133033269 [Cannabis sativa]
MSCIRWNCRGLGNPQARQFLADLVSQKKPNLLFLCETFCNKVSMERIRAQLGFDCCFVVDNWGHSGGLALMWKVANEVAIQGYSFNHIDANVTLQQSTTWCFTGVYGEPKRELRYKTWTLLRSLKNDSTLPWCIMGDLNNLGSQLEKKGGRIYPDGLIAGFNGALSDCNLLDLPLVGYPYTWEKGRTSGDWIEERLDKALVTHDWLALYAQPVLYNLEFSTSDHCPIHLVFKGVFPATSFISFRFENAWLREPLCKQLVEGCWEGSGSLTIQDKIQKCGEVLGKWGRDITGSFHKRISQCKDQIRNSKWGRDPISIQQHQEAKANLSKVLAQREIFWKQRSKQFWLNLGDKNSTVLDGVRPSVSREQNDELLLPISEEEVRSALFQMHPDKSPGPDGMTPAFYQKHWSIVGQDVVHFVPEFFHK